MYSPFLYHKQPSLGLDFSSFHSPADIAAPSVDSFELDLDLLSQDNDFFQLEVTQVNSAYSQPLLSVAGPGSAITRSSESSAPDTLSYYSDSFHSPLSTYSFPFDEMDFHKICVDDPLSLPDHTSFGTLPPTPPRSPPSLIHSKTMVPRTAHSEYTPHSRDSVFFNPLTYSPTAQSTISPAYISTPVPSSPLNHDESLTDPRKKYKCPSCPRGKYILTCLPLPTRLTPLFSIRTCIQSQDTCCHP